MRRRRATARRLQRLLLAGVALLVVAIVVVLEATDVPESVELRTVDARFALRGPRPAPDDVVVVGIDDGTLSALHESWVFSRRTFAKALRGVARDKPRVIVYDIEFSQASADIAGDNALVLATRRAGNVVLGATVTGSKMETMVFGPGAVRRRSGTTRVFGGSEAQGFAHATVGNGRLPEGPGTALRRLPYQLDGLKTLPVAAAERAGMRVDRSRFAGDGAWIDFAGPPGHLRYVPFERAVTGRYAPGTFHNRIVVIGAVAPRLADRHLTSWPGREMAGPEIQANAIHTLLRGAPLHASGRVTNILIAVGLALAPVLLTALLRPLLVFALGLATALFYTVVVQLAFDRGLILPAVVPLAGITLALFGVIAVVALTAPLERTEQRQRELFSRFLPDAVVAQVLERANTEEDLRLGGELLTATVLFSDLRGFTSFAEGRKPTEVIDVLNRYLTEMTDAILDHQGTLVAYMGDGIMAVFGAPVATDEHADMALLAAREMLGRLERFNGWIRDEGIASGFKMGIGLNTGDVLSGNVGSARRLEYTAIGDTTNTAARLEAMTKDTPHQLFVADTTYARLRQPPGDFELLDELQVRGRRAGMKVWVPRPDGDASTPVPERDAETR